NEDRHNRQSRDEKERQNGASPGQEQEHPIARTQPTNRRNPVKPGQSPRLAEAEELGRGKNAVPANQTLNLSRQRNERDAVDDSEDAQEQPTAQYIGPGTSHMISHARSAHKLL